MAFPGWKTVKLRKILYVTGHFFLMILDDSFKSLHAKILFATVMFFKYFQRIS